VNGVVHHTVTQRHRSREFTAFLEQLDARYPAALLICILLDNHSARRSRETRRFLASRPGRFEPVFTPTHASWLNYVEIFSSKMAARFCVASRSAARRNSVNEFDTMSNAYIAATYITVALVKASISW
jgi:transposase